MNLYLIFIVFFISILFSYTSNNKNKYYIYWGVSIMFSLLVGTRNISVPDTINYLEFYESISFGNMEIMSYFSFEPGFQILSQILKLLTFGNSILYFSFISIINCIILLFSIKNFDQEENFNPTLLLILYFSFFGLFYNAIVIRAGLAISVIVYTISLDYLSKRKPISKLRLKTIILFIVAISLHYSSVIGIVSYYIYKIPVKFTKNSYIILWSIFLLLALSSISEFVVNSSIKLIISLFNLFEDTDFSKYSYYISDLYELNNTLPYRVLFQFIIFLVCVLLKQNINSINGRLLNIYLVGLILSSLFFSIEQLSRITDYFLLYSSFCLYFLISSNMASKKSIFIYLFSVLPNIIFFYRIILSN